MSMKTKLKQTRLHSLKSKTYDDIYLISPLPPHPPRNEAMHGGGRILYTNEHYLTQANAITKIQFF